MPVRAQVLTEYVLGPLNNYRPRVVLDHPATSVVDITGIPGENVPTDPNGVVIEVVWTEADFAAVEADPQYRDSILWSETF